MADVLEVASYVLGRCGPMSTMKLHRLCYYAHAWHLVWDDLPLFPNRVEAWANGPVVPDLYGPLRGTFTVEPGDVPGDSARLTPAERESIDVVLDAYGHLSAHQLSLLTHQEAPWRDARADLAPLERGTSLIADTALRAFFGSLAAAETSEGRG